MFCFEDHSDEKLKKPNGCFLPLDALQFVLFFFILIQTATYIVFIRNYLPQSMSLFLSSAYYSLIMLSSILFLVSTVMTHKPAQFTSFDHKKYCKTCKEYVSKEAKHCNTCNMCRNDYDHHSRWINNCVTSSNYQYYFFATVSGFIATLFYLIAAFRILLTPQKSISIISLTHKITRFSFFASYITFTLLQIPPFVFLLIRIVKYTILQRTRVTTHKSRQGIINPDFYGFDLSFPNQKVYPNNGSL